MTLEDRVSAIVKIMNTGAELSARDVSSIYINSPTSSDVLTTGSILNTMTCLGLIKKTTYYRGKSPRHRYIKVT